MATREREIVSVIKEQIERFGAASALHCHHRISAQIGSAARISMYGSGDAVNEWRMSACALVLDEAPAVIGQFDPVGNPRDDPELLCSERLPKRDVAINVLIGSCLTCFSDEGKLSDGHSRRNASPRRRLRPSRFPWQRGLFQDRPVFSQRPRYGSDPRR